MSTPSKQNPRGNTGTLSQLPYKSDSDPHSSESDAKRLRSLQRNVRLPIYRNRLSNTDK